MGKGYHRRKIKMIIEIDNNAGFCFGVEKAIERAEEELAGQGSISCLGQIVHNGEEIKRLEKKGLKTISHDELENLKGATMLLRAHGEPPRTYRIAKENKITLIDATCPIVSRLQNRIKARYNSIDKEKEQIVIFGKEGHAEIIGLVGQTEGHALVIEEEESLERIDYTKPIYLYSQTTKSKNAFNNIRQDIENRIKETPGGDVRSLKFHQTICGQVANRETDLQDFAKKHDGILFAAGRNSSNGKVLYNVCKKANPNTHFVSNVEEVQEEMIKDCRSVGISGATSTPSWLLKDIETKLRSF